MVVKKYVFPIFQNRKKQTIFGIDYFGFSISLVAGAQDKDE